MCTSRLVPPYYVKKAREYMGPDMPITTVIGFPNGNTTTASKVFETKDALANGATEIDIVINIGELKAKNYKFVLDEINELKEACGDHTMKVIIECCLLTEEEKIKMCEIVTGRFGGVCHPRHDCPHGEDLFGKRRRQNWRRQHHRGHCSQHQAFESQPSGFNYPL